MFKKKIDDVKAMPMHREQEPQFEITYNAPFSPPIDNGDNSELEVPTPISNSNSASDNTSNSDYIPKFYHIKARFVLKQKLIKELLKEFIEPVTFNWVSPDGKTHNLTYQEDEKAAIEYNKELQRLSITDIIKIKHTEKYEFKNWNIIEKLTNSKSKKKCVVTIINANKTKTPYLVSSALRFFKIDGMKYLKMTVYALPDTRSKMSEYMFYENNPFPIVFQNDFKTLDPVNGITIPDGKFLKATEKFEFAQAMASSNLEKNTNLILVFVILNVILTFLVNILVIVVMRAVKVF